MSLVRRGRCDQGGLSPLRSEHTQGQQVSCAYLLVLSKERRLMSFLCKPSSSVHLTEEPSGKTCQRSSVSAQCLSQPGVAIIWHHLIFFNILNTDVLIFFFKRVGNCELLLMVLMIDIECFYFKKPNLLVSGIL